MEIPVPTTIDPPKRIPDNVCDEILAAGYSKISVLLDGVTTMAWRSGHGTIFIGSPNGEVNQFDACGGFIAQVTEANTI